jgi:hypothetical protein
MAKKSYHNIGPRLGNDLKVTVPSVLPFLSQNVANASPGADYRVARWFVFKTKNPNLGQFWKSLEWKMLLYFMIIWNILWPFGIMYGSLVQFVVIWYIFPILVCLDQAKSGNPGAEPKNSEWETATFIYFYLRF